jgi:hypothetical protein
MPDRGGLTLLFAAAELTGSPGLADSDDDYRRSDRRRSHPGARSKTANELMVRDRTMRLRTTVGSLGPKRLSVRCR